MQKLLTPIVIFVAVLLAMIFGEGLFAFIWDTLSYLVGLLGYWKVIFSTFSDFISNNPYKIVIALIIAIVASVWIFKNQPESVEQSSNKRKMAIVLAILLGWLGAHRFYLGQFGYGLIYIIISLIFAPLVVLLSLIDAIRFFLSSDEEFLLKYPF